MASNFANHMKSVSKYDPRKKNYEYDDEDDDDEDAIDQIASMMFCLNALARAGGRADSDDYDEDDDDDDEDDDDDDDDDGESMLRKTKNFRKLRKISSIFFKVEKLKNDPREYLKIKFNKLRGQIDSRAKKIISHARKQGNSGKKVKKLRVRQNEMLAEVNKVELECERGLQTNKDDIKAQALKLHDILSTAPENNVEKKLGMEALVDELVDTPRKFNQLMFLLYAGHRINYVESTAGPDADKKLGTLNSSYCFDYQIMSPIDGAQMPVENAQAESIYYFEVSISFK
jgi:hypothetical protein